MMDSVYKVERAGVWALIFAEEVKAFTTGDKEEHGGNSRLISVDLLDAIS
jgi:hypothetical protein